MNQALKSTRFVIIDKFVIQNSTFWQDKKIIVLLFYAEWKRYTDCCSCTSYTSCVLALMVHIMSVTHSLYACTCLVHYRTFLAIINYIFSPSKANCYRHHFEMKAGRMTVKKSLEMKLFLTNCFFSGCNCYKEDYSYKESWDRSCTNGCQVKQKIEVSLCLHLI